MAKPEITRFEAPDELVRGESPQDAYGAAIDPDSFDVQLKLEALQDGVVQQSATLGMMLLDKSIELRLLADHPDVLIVPVPGEKGHWKLSGKEATP